MQKRSSSTTARKAVGIAILALALAVLAGCGSAGQPQAATQSTRTTAESARPTPQPSAPPAQQAEPATPLSVSITMDKAPALNAEAQVILEVQAAEDAPGTTAELQLPPAAQLITGDLRWQGDLAAGEVARLAATIKFTEEGQYTIEGRALRPVNADMVWGDSDEIYLTVTAQGGSFGFDSGATPGVTAGPAPGSDR